LATIAMLKGREAVVWLRSLGVRHLIIDEDDTIGGTEAGTTGLTPSC
jgi:hypothetical protein